MNWFIHEWRLIWASRFTVTGLLLLFALSTVAVTSGIREISDQQQTIDHLKKIQQQELSAQKIKFLQKEDAGSVAYYTFLDTWNDPSSAAFLALGFRDTNPYTLRIRALALQTQLHENEIFNPELALVGRFDFAFVLVYLTPLILIALLYDLVSSERHAGRLTTLLSLSQKTHMLWMRRSCLRAFLTFTCLYLPLLIAGLITGMSFSAYIIVLITVLAYVFFWTGLILVIGTKNNSSITNATSLMGSWIILTLIIPTIGNSIQTQFFPVKQGVELMLAQRQAVHAAWDTPREDIMKKFFQSYPQWQHTSALPTGFHWKWYYAFQQLGDENVTTQVASYRAGLLKRQQWSQYLGWFIPSIGVQNILHRTAKTDLLAQLTYQDEIAVFHKQLRHYYYPYLFNEIKFKAKDFESLPRFKPFKTDNPSILSTSLLVIMFIASLMLFIGIRATSKIKT